MPFTRLYSNEASEKQEKIKEVEEKRLKQKRKNEQAALLLQQLQILKEARHLTEFLRDIPEHVIKANSEIYYKV